MKCTVAQSIRGYRFGAVHVAILFQSFKMSSEVPDLCRHLQQRHGLQVLFDYHVHDHLEDHLDAGGVGRCGEVVVDELAGCAVERDEGGGDEAGGRVHIAVCAFKLWQV